MACLFAAGILGLAAMHVSSADAKSRESASAGSYVLESKRRARGPRIPLPIGPSYLYYDYPYYYSRGHYPTHIGGYVYYGPRSVNRCSSSYRRCIAKLSKLPARQRRACRCR
jgi:hypothetical protein